FPFAQDPTTLTNTTTDPTAATPAPTVPQPLTRPHAAAVRVQARQALVAQLIRENDGRVPTHLHLLNELRRKGVRTSKGTVMNDLYALGLSDAPTAYRPPTNPGPLLRNSAD